MIIQTTISLIIQGDAFSPKHFSSLTGVTFDRVIEKGETVMPLGRYKGKLAPYSVAELLVVTEPEEDYNEALSILLNRFHRCTSPYLNQSHIDSIVLWLTILNGGDGQRGFEIRPDSLLLLGQLNATLAINISEQID